MRGCLHMQKAGLLSLLLGLVFVCGACNRETTNPPNNKEIINTKADTTDIHTGLILTQESDLDLSLLKDVSLDIKEFDATRIVFSVGNMMKEDIIYLSNPMKSLIEINREGKWFTLYRTNTIITDESYVLEEGKTKEFVLYFSRTYGQLSSGNYRLIVPIRYLDEVYYVGGEFEID